MHRDILNLHEIGIKIVDHRDRNGLNNQRSNLRITDKQLNGHNGNIRKNNSSGYRGVNWDKKTNKWLARIRINNKRINLGRFRDISSAAIAYDKAAISFYGKEATLNLIKG
jgi:hypothetical protein